MPFITLMRAQPSSALNTAEWVDISGGTCGPLRGCFGRTDHAFTAHWRPLRGTLGGFVFGAWAWRRPSRLQPAGGQQYQVRPGHRGGQDGFNMTENETWALSRAVTKLPGTTRHNRLRDGKTQHTASGASHAWFRPTLLPVTGQLAGLRPSGSRLGGFPPTSGWTLTPGSPNCTRSPPPICPTPYCVEGMARSG